MINKTNKSASGTSFHGDVINATYNQLVACFGEPTYINGIQDKSQYDWVLGYKNAFVFTIYDWKEYKHIRPDDMISWHIGATEPEYSTIALEAVNKVLHGTDLEHDYDYDWEFNDITEPATDMQEDDVEKLAEEEYPIIPNTSPNVNWDRANKQEGFERGYNKAREKYKFTEEHAKYLFECGRNFQVNADITFTVAREHLSQPKTPTHFEFEMESMTIDEIREQGKGFLHASTFKIKTTNSQGQQVACGKYIY